MKTVERIKTKAQEIVDICAEIEDCETALEALSAKEELETVNIFVQKDKDDMGVFIPIDRNTAINVIKELLRVLCANCDALIKKGVG